MQDTWEAPKSDRFRREAVQVTFEEAPAQSNLLSQAFPAFLGVVAGTVLAVATLYALGWLPG
ncbi:MAG: hypothetical protein HZY79_05245 [Rhodoblastus sp.]|nr:MAG: hypothetical protein HZY79_05245 [Rhodoblastus sp.]